MVDDAGELLWSHDFEKVMPVYGDYGESKRYFYEWRRLSSGTVLRQVRRCGQAATTWSWRKLNWNFEWVREWTQVDPFPVPLDGLKALIEDSGMDPNEAEILLAGSK